MAVSHEAIYTWLHALPKGELATMEIALTDRPDAPPAAGPGPARSKGARIAGMGSMLAGMVVSIWLFSNQTDYVGVVARNFPGVGDITFAVGLLVTAALYLMLRSISPERKGTARREAQRDSAWPRASCQQARDPVTRGR